MRDKLTPKNIIFFAIVGFFPLLMYAVDYISQLLSYRDIFLPTPSGDYILYIVVQIGLYTLLAVGLNIVCGFTGLLDLATNCLLYTSPSPRDRTRSRMPSSA